jgi:glycine/D-amino acid oxidase-like deaminating enzyme
MNTALFCEELISSMLDQYEGRFRVYENTAVRRIEAADGVLLATRKNIVRAEQVVLCTNGYSGLGIVVSEGLLKQLVKGVIGFMTGYLHEKERGPAATVYFRFGRQDQYNNYFYLSRREYIEGPYRELISLGGPDQPLEEGERYNPLEVSEAGKYYAQIDKFYVDTISDAPRDLQRNFSWNGLMGYTRNGIRMIGPDPRNPALIYNLGCNGIGILPAIYGGKKVAQFITGEKLGPSIFDPAHQLRKEEAKKASTQAQES